MDHKKLPIIISCLALCIIGLISCAQYSIPLGGPKDVQPPKIIEEKSSSNYQTNFDKQDILLEFDEFIQLKDPTRNVIITPPLLRIPKITAKGKKITFEFPEEELLKKDATYIINFGKSISDFTEGNPLTDYRFVFSTGAFIDSLEFSGKVVDAYSGEPIEEASVMLYDQLQDSIVYRERPFYFCSTDKSGNFKFSNLKSDSFKLFVLKDENLNYIFDLDAERIGFVDKFIFTSDSLDYNPTIRMSLMDQKIKIVSKELVNYGNYKVELNQTPDSLSVIPIDTFEFLALNQNDKTVNFTFDITRSSAQFELREKGEVIDTISLNNRKRKDYIAKSKLEIINRKPNRKILQDLETDFMLEFNHPIRWYNDSLILLQDTSGKSYDYDISLEEPLRKKLHVKSKWKAKELMTLVLDSTAIKDVYGLSNDSIAFNFSISENKLSSYLSLNTDSLDAKTNYVLILKKDKKVIEVSRIKADSKAPLIYEKLEPGKYAIELIEDLNNNGKWDPANYLQHIQAERVRFIDLQDLKENWEHTETIIWKD